jgi:hypothetical protein
MFNNCPLCGEELRKAEIKTLSEQLQLLIPFCPECPFHSTTTELPLSMLSGKVLRSIDRKTGRFRLKIRHPKTKRGEITVQTFKRNRTIKASEFQGPTIIVDESKGRDSKDFPEVKRKDEIAVVGFQRRKMPFQSVLIHNSTRKRITVFVEVEVNLKKGFMSSSKVRNPLLIQAEDTISNFLKKRI